MNWQTIGLWCAILVVILLVAVCAHYGLGQLRQQNHKIASMMSLVSTLAEEVHGMKQPPGPLQQPFASTQQPQQQLQQLQHGGSGGMIEVSDGEGEEDEDNEDDISDIEDMEDMEDGEDEDEEEGEEDDETDEEEEEEDTVMVLEELDADKMIENVEDMQVFEALPEGAQTATDKFLQEMAAAGAGGMSISVVYMDQVSMPSNMFSNLNLDMGDFEPRVTELPDIDNESKATAATGTKRSNKPGVNDLRQQVLERGLATSSAASKMKKPELLKLLESGNN